MTDEKVTEAADEAMVSAAKAAIEPDGSTAMPEPIELENLLDRLKEKNAKAEPCSIALFGLADKPPKAEVLLLTCIDYRYSNGIHAIMQAKYGTKYDQVSLAGAGLSGVIDFGIDMKPHWAQTVLEHVALSIQLHQIKTVLIMDHRSCGAYTRYVGLPDRDYEKEDSVTALVRNVQEYLAHKKHVTRLAHLLEEKFDKLEVIGILLSRLPEHPTPSDPLTYVPLYGTM